MTEVENRSVQASGIGAILRDNRLRKKRELSEVADTLHIRRTFLEAIEEGRYADLPGTTYAAGFIRAYADYLGLDSDEVVRRHKLETSGLANSGGLHFPSPASEGGIPKGALLLVSAVLAVLAYGGWYLFFAKTDTVVELIPPVPERLVASSGPIPGSSGSTNAPHGVGLEQEGQTRAEDVPIQNTSAEDRGAVASAATDGAGAAAAARGLEPSWSSDATASEGGQIGQVADGDVDKVSAAASEPAAEEAAKRPDREETPSAKPAEAAAVADSGLKADTPPQGGPGPEEGAQIVLRAVADSWVEVRDRSRRVVLSRILKPGDSFAVPDQPGLTMVTGNAGGLEILVDGQAIPPLGKAGAIKRGVVLEAGALHGFATAAVEAR